MRYDNIEYNDEWQSVPVVRAEPVADDYDDTAYEEDYDTYSGQSNDFESFSNKAISKKEVTPQPVIKLQFLLAVIILIVAFVLKNYGGNLYTTVSDWYFSNLNNSLVITMNTENNTLPTDAQTDNQTEQSNQAVTQPQQYTQSTEPITEIATELTTEPTQATQPSTEETTLAPTEDNEDENEY